MRTQDNRHRKRHKIASKIFNGWIDNESTVDNEKTDYILDMRLELL